MASTWLALLVALATPAGAQTPSPSSKLRVAQLVPSGKIPDPFRRALATEMDVVVLPIGKLTAANRSAAEVLLISDDGEPVLARWCYGAGTAAVWTTDFDGTWSASWTKWSGYTRFWTQLVRGLRMKCAAG